MYKDKIAGNLGLIYDHTIDIPKHQIEMYNSIIKHIKKPKETSLGYFIDRVLLNIIKEIIRKNKELP